MRYAGSNEFKVRMKLMQILDRRTTDTGSQRPGCLTQSHRWRPRHTKRSVGYAKTWIKQLNRACQVFWFRR